ncbi:unnamed protein product [Parnassius apollo]|uniref:Cohesin loading complex subunit SCC4 homolog n=1 Tax=Parnassius apollo TaxID=110799 RepID=A0A8S3XLI6_PARAO|nr:unnamed protein product [Parnassius apollo]
MASTQDAWYISLLGLAEHFRTSNPPDIKSCIQCLQAVFNFKPPQRVEARTHLQLGNILLTHTKNIDLARTHLEQSWFLSQSINAFDDVKFEAASVLAELFEQQGQPTHSKPILRKAIELSQHSVYWHCRLIFQLAQIHATEREYEVASSLLGVGVDYAQISNAAYTRVLFLLSRVMLLLIDKKIQEVLPLLNQAGHLVESWSGSPHQKEYLKVFFLVLQVCHYLMAGQVKSVKPCLKQLQQSIQTIMAPTWPDDDAVCGSAAGESFVWLSRQQLYVLVYLVTVMHSAQAGYMDKAHKYTEKALAQIDKLTSSGCEESSNKGGARSGAVLAWRLRMALVEHAALCRLVAGGKAHALHEIARAAHLLTVAPTGTYQHQQKQGGARGAVPANGGRQGARAARVRTSRAPAHRRTHRYVSTTTKTRWSARRCAGWWRAGRRTRCTRSHEPRTCSPLHTPVRINNNNKVEHAALCRLVAGGKAHALHEIARAGHLLTIAPTGTYQQQQQGGARDAVPAGDGRQGARVARDSIIIQCNIA